MERRLVDRANVASRLHREAGWARAPGTRMPGARERQPSRALPHAFVHDNMSRVPGAVAGPGDRAANIFRPHAASRRREGRQHRVPWPQHARWW